MGRKIYPLSNLALSDDGFSESGVLFILAGLFSDLASELLLTAELAESGVKKKI
jgi:hypothetical protein